MDKGYAQVTMADFCQACGLSRGGLYRHFHSTAEIFEAMLQRDKTDWAQKMEAAMQAGTSAAQMVRRYLEQAQADMLAGAGRLSLAAYEYAHADPSHIAFAQARYAAAVQMMTVLLEYGMARGEFRALDARQTARHWVIFLDGLRMAGVFAVDGADIARQLDTLYQSILEEEPS